MLFDGNACRSFIQQKVIACYKNVLFVLNICIAHALTLIMHSIHHTLAHIYHALALISIIELIVIAQYKESETSREQEVWRTYKNQLVDLSELKNRTIELGKTLNEYALSNAHRGQLLGCFARAISGDDLLDIERFPSPLFHDVLTPEMVEGKDPFHGSYKQHAQHTRLV